MNRGKVILVDDQDRVVGEMDKLQAHKEGLLHRAFSVFLFNSKGEMLLQQRAEEKYHGGGLWTNACCSHPQWNETNEEAAGRRIEEELNIKAPLEEIFSFTYCEKVENGLTEHEFDHVFVGFYEGEIKPDPEEVMDVNWKSMEEIEGQLERKPELYTSWFKIAFPKIKAWWNQNNELFKGRSL